LDLGAGPMPFISQYTIFLAHFTGATVDWQRSFGGPASQRLAGLARDAAGNLLLAGSFEQSLDFGGPPLTSAGTSALFQATLDASGGFVADQSFDSTGSFPSVTGVAVDAAGSTLITGLFDASLAIGAMPLVCDGDINGYLAKIDAAGEVAFAQATPSPMGSVNQLACVAADASNNVVWGTDLLFIVDGADQLAGRIAKLDPSGAELWSVAGPNFGPRAFAFDADGDVIAVGEFSTEIDFAKDGPIVATMGINAFIAKFPP
jgi:hypothetical protein